MDTHVQYLLLKNQFGAVIIAYTHRDHPVLGFAFCNPINFPNSRLSRKEWWKQGKRISSGRRAKFPTQYTVNMEREFMGRDLMDLKLTPKEWQKRFRTKVIELLIYLSGIPTKTSTYFCFPEYFGLKPYKGKGTAAFTTWAGPFIYKLFQDRRNRLEKP